MPLSFTPTPLSRTYEAAVRDLPSRRPGVRASAARDLGLAGGAHPHEAAGMLAPLLEDGEAEVRAAAASALEMLGASQCLESLGRLFGDPDTAVRQAAVMAVASLGGPRAVALLSAALDDAQPDVRFQALMGLAQADPAAGLEASLRALDSEDRWIVAEAATQLGALMAGSPDAALQDRVDAVRGEAIARLAQLLDGPAGRATVAAALSLGKVGDARAVPVLAGLVRGTTRLPDDDAAELTSRAIGLLGELGGPEARAALEELAWRVLPSQHRALARAALARLGDERAVADILAGLRSAWPGRRNAAVQLAGMGRVHAATATLLDLLREGGADPAVVVEALGLVDDPRAREALEQMADATDREDLREAARRALDGG